MEILNSLNILIIASVIIVLTLFVGALLAYAFTRLSNVVTGSYETQAREKAAYNPALTLGHKIPVEADVDKQLKEARKLAAKQAAQQPRGANMRIGRLGAENLATAYKGIQQDPITATKIAAFHGWQGVRTGPTAGNGAAARGAAGPAAGRPAAAAKRPQDLVPGKDYPLVQVTDGMSGLEKRRARIANAKAKSAAIKALKQAGATGAPIEVGQEAAPAAVGVVAEAPAVEEAIPGLIEITPDMSPEEVRKARIANAKAQSAAAKARKASGVAPAAAPAAAPVAAPVEEAAEEEAIPGLIEITPDMSPEEVRKARIANAKAQSAAAKARKAAGLAPAPRASAGPAATAASPQAVTPAEPTPVTEHRPVATGQPTGIPRPAYIEITDGMPPDEIRQARITNAKLKSAYQKALKEAGIDPATVGE
jgi:hypothetical protein